LHATKVLGAGEGGVGVFGSSIWAAKARAWANFGRFENDHMPNGSNSKMSEVQAAFCLTRFDCWQIEKAEWLQARSRVEELSSMFELSLTPVEATSVNPYWVVRFPSGHHRAAVEEIFQKNNIATRRWWGQDLAAIAGGLAQPNSLDLINETLGLPFFRSMGSDALNKIRGALNDSQKSLGPLSRKVS
jgi:dTDP-4-amino-4,6-dideoxygalactose transaminase